MEISNSFDICAGIADALISNKAFADLAQGAYGKDWTVEIGFDGLRQDWKKAAPFCILLPQTMENDGEGNITYGTGILLGVVDKRMGEESTRHMQGIAFLSAQAMPMLIHIVQNALDGMHGVSFSQYECEYDYEAFPLIYCNVGLTFTQRLAIGGRRK